MSEGLDELLSGVDMTPRRKVVKKPNGDLFEFYATPTTLDERDRARKEAKEDDNTDFAITLLVQKARRKDGRRRFTLDDALPLKRKCPASLAEAILEKLLNDESDDPNDAVDVESEAVDPPTPKRSQIGSEKTAA